MQRNEINDQTRVVVQRVVTVSTEHTLEELAKMTGEDISDLVWIFRNKGEDTWLNDNTLAEMVPSFHSGMTEDGDTIDADVWRISEIRP